MHILFMSIGRAFVVNIRLQNGVSDIVLGQHDIIKHICITITELRLCQYHLTIFCQYNENKNHHITIHFDRPLYCRIRDHHWMANIVSATLYFSHCHMQIFYNGYLLYDLLSEIGPVVDTFLLKKGEKNLKISKG